MRRSVSLLAILAFAAATAPISESDAKPRGCFTKAEQTAEEVVRYGLRLRESGRACDEPPWEAGTAPLWEAVDKQFGSQFKQQTDTREKAFVREFENDAVNKLTQWNSRIVFYYRHYPLSAVYCGGIKATLVDIPKKPWSKLVKQAVIARDDIRMTYQPCDL
jgi:hypothetical protein